VKYKEQAIPREVMGAWRRCPSLLRNWCGKKQSVDSPSEQRDAYAE
jgi:hypothetical protein